MVACCEAQESESGRPATLGGPYCDRPRCVALEALLPDGWYRRPCARGGPACICARKVSGAPFRGFDRPSYAVLRGVARRSTVRCRTPRGLRRAQACCNLDTAQHRQRCCRGLCHWLCPGGQVVVVLLRA